MRAMLILLVALLAAGCQATEVSDLQVHPSTTQWSLSFNEPFFMKAWVEDSAVEDINGKMFQRAGGGRASGGEPQDGTESARGWGKNVTGSIREVVGADLPKRIYVRWQSIVESQTYRAWVDIPEEARQIMQASVTQLCPSSPQNGPNSLALVYVGLAPGGIVEVRVADACMKSIKVARTQAEIEPLGPDQGKSQGQYAYPVSEKAKRYIETYGIPYGSW